MILIATGNPFDGIQIIGPFGNYEEAAHYAECNCEEWWIPDVADPQDYVNEHVREKEA